MQDLAEKVEGPDNRMNSVHIWEVDSRLEILQVLRGAGELEADGQRTAYRWRLYSPFASQAGLADLRAAPKLSHILH